MHQTGANFFFPFCAKNESTCDLKQFGKKIGFGESSTFYVLLKQVNGPKNNAILFHGHVLRELGQESC